MKLVFLLSTYLVWLGLCVFASVFQWLALRVARVPIKTCKLFAGPTIAGVSVGGSRVELGCIPVGTSIAFDVPAFRGSPIWVRLAVVLVGPCALLICAVAALGPPLAWHHFLAGFVELPLGAWHPQTLAVHLVGRWHDVLANSVLAATGGLATKLAALELLPLGGMTTAQVLKQLANPDEEDYHHWSVTLTTITALTLWLIMLLWSVAAMFYVVPKGG